MYNIQLFSVGMVHTTHDEFKHDEKLSVLKYDMTDQNVYQNSLECQTIVYAVCHAIFTENGCLLKTFCSYTISFFT